MDSSEIQYWVQNYSVVGGSQTLTAIIALIPIFFFLIALTVLKMKGHIAALLTLIIAIVVSVGLYEMPVASALSAATYGILGGLWPIGWIIIWALFIYNVTVKTGQFEVIRSFISKVSDDQRVQVLLIALAFGVFLEGVAGFGTPIAIGAALLLGCGMRSAVLAAATCLVANLASAPTGAIGIPVIVASQVTGIDLHQVTALVGRQLLVIGFIVPFWLVAMVDGVRGIKDTLPLTLLCSVVGAVAIFIIYEYIGPELADVILGIVLLITVIGFSKIWKPKNMLTAEGYVEGSQAVASEKADEKTYTLGQTVFAWSPFIMVTVFALLWTTGTVKNALDAFTIKFPMPFVHQAIIKGAPLAVEGQAPEAAVWSFDILKSVGTALMFAALYTAIAFRLGFKGFVEVLTATAKQLMFPVLTICFVLAFARVADYSGQTASIALLLSQTGQVFPAIAPLLGMLGVFLTGSVVNSNTLFAKVQLITAQQIGVSQPLLVASNTLGSICGKVISPQSIVIGCAATKNTGNEGLLLSAVLKHAFIFIVFICFMTYAQAYLVPWTTVV